MLVLLVNVLPHDEEDGGADEAVLDRAREEERARRREEAGHDVARVTAPVAQADLQACRGARSGVGLDLRCSGCQPGLILDVYTFSKHFVFPTKLTFWSIS